MTITRIKELRRELELEQISLSQIVEIGNEAGAAGITITDEMLAGDLLDALEDQL